MSCSCNRDDLMLWLDGELPQERLEEVQRHLEECSECRQFIEAQSRMEKVWREAWQDPDQMEFYAMRKAVRGQAAPPWWRKQRNWIAVAAVFAVYLGVKIFIVDPQGSSLSQYATEEMERSALSSDTESLNQLVEESPEVVVIGDATVEEAEEQVEEEIEEQIAADEPHEAEQVATSDHQVQPELEAVEEGHQSVSSAMADVLEEEISLDICLSTDEMSEGTGGLVGFTGIEQSEARGSSGYMAADEAPGDHQEDGLTLGGAATSGSGGGGFGGAAAECPAVYSSASGESAEAGTEEEADFDDSLHRTVLAETAVLECIASRDDMAANSDMESSEFYTVTASLSTGDSITLTRDSWAELYDLIDTLATKLDCFDQVITMSIDSLGTVTGDCISGDETRISVPVEDLRDCSVTVYFH